MEGSIEEYQLVGRAEAAKRLGLAPKTLANWASQGEGPTPIRMYGRVLYRVTEIEDFAKVRAPETHLSPAQAAKLLAKSPKTLANWRCDGLGPAWEKRGKRILYPTSAIVEFIESRSR